MQTKKKVVMLAGVLGLSLAGHGRIGKKIRKVQSMRPQYQHSGGDLRTVGPLAQKIDRHIKAGEFEQLEKTLDDILVIIKA